MIARTMAFAAVLLIGGCDKPGPPPPSPDSSDTAAASSSAGDGAQDAQSSDPAQAAAMDELRNEQSALTETGDPAAADAAGRLGDFEAYAEYVYFATGCGVFKTDAPAAILVQQHAESLSRWLVMNRLPQGDVRLTFEAEAAGKARAQRPGECDYWRRSPDEVHRLTEEALASEQ